MVSEITITLPLPPSKNRITAMHWAARGRLKQEWAQTAYGCWLEAGRPKFQQATVYMVFFVAKLRDEDNLFSLAVKGIFDGLKGHLVPDDAPEYLAIEHSQEIDRKNQRLELRVQSRPAGEEKKS
jgi:hypothetical protein